MGVTSNAAELNWDEPFAPSSATATGHIRTFTSNNTQGTYQPPSYSGWTFNTKTLLYEKEDDMIDETQICKLDAMRKARNEVAEYLQAKHDRAALMRIQAAALEDEVAYGYGQINEEMPMPVDQPMVDD